LSKDISFQISDPNAEIATWVDLLRWRATQQSEQRVYSFLSDGETEKDHLTFAELDQQARIVGATLQGMTERGDRALLIYPSGIEFIVAFFGCLYSGIIAVPVYPPSAARSDRTLSKFRATASDARPTVILTTTVLLSRVEGLLMQSPELRGVRVITTDTLPVEAGEHWRNPEVHRETLAFFQYTSGSTGLPKGVMVTHGNLLHNSSLILRYCQHPATAHGVTWLPLYHDLGLIGGVLQPLYAGYESTLMSPAAFLQRPIRWLQAVSRTKATISGGPNFAYDLCVRKITPEQKATLDLSHWEIVANGAEPVRAETMERFAEAFASCGFRRENFYPCYGLAEATLVVSAGKKGHFPVVQSFSGKELERNQVQEAAADEKDSRTLVSIGASHPDQTVVIVDPDTLTACPSNRVGEIWVAGPSVAQGYWQRTEESEATFRAHLASGEGPFLRTGDLGFIRDGELFITGRLKDLIIIRGSNHYPQDIELTVEKSHAALRAGCGVAFSVEAGGEEQLVIVYEVERQYLNKQHEEIFAAIRAAIAEHHELQTYAIVLVKTGSIPKTSSGKVQRRASRDGFLDGGLDVVGQWILDLDDSQASEPVQEMGAVASNDAQKQIVASKSAATIQNWLVAKIAELLRVKRQEVDVNVPFAHYGMDSVQAVALSADLEEWLGRDLAPTLVYDYPNIEALARHLAGDSATHDVGDAEHERDKTEAETIAIVGMSCRFPGADSLDEFWQLLRNGVDGISEVPARRWDLQEFYDPNRATPGKMNTRWGGFLKQVDQFDPYFFGISPREASRMDPQQRLLLEVAWEALEHAGQAPERFSGSQTGVFVGISSNDYAQLQYNDIEQIDAYSGTGNAHSIAANRLSYLLDLRGPSMAIDTACSSSLVAVHLACQSIRNGECDMALAGGVNLILTPELTITFSQARMMSEYGRCRTFDDEADGYVRGEGCGVVVLKPLSAAVRDGDNILALIRGSAVNQDGRSNGLTAPNGPSQEAVIRQAQRNAGVMAEEIGYVETHGSSTPLGDPIEFDSLKAVLMPGRTQDQSCIIGSVKTNIGHLEAAAGIAGLIKTVLSLHKGEIPPHLHLKKLNSHISLENTTFIIPTQRHTWPEKRRRLAGVSAFGFGGTNAHVILEDAPVFVSAISENDRPQHVLALSARSEQALRTLAQRYEEFLSANPTASVADMGCTANSGRAHFAHRLAIVSDSATHLREQLAAVVAGQSAKSVQRGRVQNKERPKIAFLFTGQGSQYIGMGRQLYDTQPVFRKALDRCDEILRPYLMQPLLSVLYPEPGVASPLDETAYTQPALFALEYALAEMWRAWGVEPDIVMGHSVGEYVAACIAGLFSLEDGLKLIAARGRLMQDLPPDGEMIVIFAEQERVASEIAQGDASGPYSDRVSLAALNGPQNTVISGEREAVRAVARRLEEQGLTTYSMTVSHAFHSPLMEPILDALEQTAEQVRFDPVHTPLVCNLNGKILEVGETLDANYWRQHTREAVQFAAGIQTLAEQGYELFVELGPTPVLVGMGKRCLPDSANSSYTWLASLRKGQEDWQAVLQSVATLYVKGMNLDWIGFDSDYVRHRIALPTYPFEREYYWLEPTLRNGEAARSSSVNADSASHHQHDAALGQAKNGTNGALAGDAQEQLQKHPLLDAHVELVHPAGVHVWESSLDKQHLPYLNDHRIQGAMALPVSVYVEMAQAAMVAAFGAGAHVLAEIELKKLLLLPEKGAQRVQVVLSPEANEHVSFHVYSHSVGVPDQPRTAWTLHASGKILAEKVS
jgi:acyl transferase domain-containing protein/acyl-CoA synthetase (AMP-forming)/AMP-acid ligase II/acyl carrier protein